MSNGKMAAFYRCFTEYWTEQCYPTTAKDLCKEHVRYYTMNAYAYAYAYASYGTATPRNVRDKPSFVSCSLELGGGSWGVGVWDSQSERAPRPILMLSRRQAALADPVWGSLVSLVSLVAVCHDPTTGSRSAIYLRYLR